MGSFGSSQGSKQLKPPSCGPKSGPRKTGSAQRTNVGSTKPSTTATSFKYDFNPSRSDPSANHDMMMLTEKQQQQFQYSTDIMPFDYQENYNQLQSKNQGQRSKALEELMRHIVTLDKEEISFEVQNPNS